MSFICSEARRTLVRIARANTSSPAAARFLRTASLRWQCAATPNWPMSTTGVRSKPSVSSQITNCHGNKRSIFSRKVIRDYEELHKEYRDQEGLSFGKHLDEAQVERIFGHDLTEKSANYLLRVLHGRRVAGTLEDPAYAPNTSQFSAAQMATALAYLRKTVPVEEIRNAGLRAEDELNQLEKDEAEKKKALATGEEESEQADENAEVKVDPVYGQSQFDQIRARNHAKQAAREKAMEAEKLEKEERDAAAGATSGPLAIREDGKRAITNPKIMEYYAKASSDIEAPPEMKAWQRVLPSATLVGLLLGFMAAVGMVYEEPSPRYRFLRELSTAQATIATIIGINVVVWLGWKAPPLWRLFNQYMMFSVATAKPVSMVTSMFSHMRINHLIVNMFPLWFVGTQMHEELGRADFLTLFLGCGSIGFLGSLVTYTMRGWLTVTSLGSSGATLGLCSAYFWEHRADGFKILGLPQDGVHGIVFLALLVALQLSAFGRTAQLKMDLASHLSGMAAGIAGIELLNRTKRRTEGRHDKAVIEFLPPGAKPEIE